MVEIVEKHMHLIHWDHFCKEREVPIGCEYLYVHSKILQMIVKVRQMCLY